VKLLLTSNGVNNASIHEALVDLLGKPIAEATALCIPTAIYPFDVGPEMAYKFLTGASNPMCTLGWKSVGVLELTALPSVDKEVWVEVVRNADALLVYGGDPAYLTYWFRQSGLAELMPSLHDTVYVGTSAGSIALTARNCDVELGDRKTPDGSDPSLGLVDFTLIPHVGNPRHEDATLETVEAWVATTGVPTYALDDQSAIKVDGDAVEVVSEGNRWELVTP
jgi:dipeptidase E